MDVTIHAPDGRRWTVSLSEGVAVIGRSRDSQIHLPDQYVSRLHAELEETPEGWLVRDCNSKGGTYLNGRPVLEPTPVHDGDRLQVGKTQILFGDASRRARSQETIVSVTDNEFRGVPLHSFRTLETPETGLARIMMQASREMTKQRTADDTLHALLELAVRAVNVERGLIAVCEPDGSWTTKAVVSESEFSELNISQAVRSRVLDRAETLYLEDIIEDEDIALANSIVRQGIRSVYCAPLSPSASTRGLLYLDSLTRRVSFTESQLELVTVLAGMAGLTLENDSARRAAEQARALQAQLSAAAEIQRRLLPRSELPSPSGFRVAAHHRACQTVGGDLYDVWPHGSGAGLMLADVAGKGLEAALIMANLHARWRGVRGGDVVPDAWLEQINGDLMDYLPDNRFVTMTFALAVPERDELLIANAGHLAVLIVRGAEIESLPATGPVIGVFEKFDSGLRHVPFGPGDLIVVYSDGVPDQQNAKGAPFGTERIEEIVRRHARETPDELVAAIVDDVERYAGVMPQDDDLTLLALQRLS
ncbi:MAG: SpoIIE family protein phosphatase [Acidobacteriota bacterium]|nr:MAG: SpoIIE family protein phosphatase [Acidobacteriota bacterium]